MVPCNNKTFAQEMVYHLWPVVCLHGLSGTSSKYGVYVDKYNSIYVTRPLQAKLEQLKIKSAKNGSHNYHTLIKHSVLS